MPCYHPLSGWKSATINPATGKRPVVFRASEAYRDLPVTVACGRCIGCRLERSRQWAVRLMHEAQLHADGVFLTLTYDQQHLPAGGTLVKKHFQDFMKRLRKLYPPRSVRYFHCGEYGSRTRRPHYHAIVFGVQFADQVFFKEKNGHRLFISEQLMRLWPFGSSLIGAVTFESAAYVARYCVEKMHFFGEFEYEHIDLETGEVLPVQEEYVTMSLKPAIARNWFEQFKGETYRDDSVVMRGIEMKPPKFYDRCIELEDAELLERVKAERRAKARLYREHNTDERLRVREQVKLAQVSQLNREV